MIEMYEEKILLKELKKFKINHKNVRNIKDKLPLSPEDMHFTVVSYF